MNDNPAQGSEYGQSRAAGRLPSHTDQDQRRVRGSLAAICERLGGARGRALSPSQVQKCYRKNFALFFLSSTVTFQNCCSYLNCGLCFQSALFTLYIFTHEAFFPSPAAFKGRYLQFQLKLTLYAVQAWASLICCVIFYTRAP